MLNLPQLNSPRLTYVQFGQPVELDITHPESRQIDAIILVPSHDWNHSRLRHWKKITSTFTQKRTLHNFLIAWSN